jgi:hypothetical protein
MTRKEQEAWFNHLLGNPCPMHPHKIIKNGHWGLWCGEKDEFNTWCNGGSVTKEFLELIRKEKV